MDKQHLEIVKRRIKTLGLKKSFLADKIGVTSVMFSYYLSGERKLSKEKENKLFKYIGL